MICKTLTFILPLMFESANDFRNDKEDLLFLSNIIKT